MLGLRAVFNYARFGRADFSGAMFEEARFEGAEFEWVDFSSTRLVEAVFTDSNVIGIDGSGDARFIRWLNFDQTIVEKLLTIIKVTDDNLSASSLESELLGRSIDECIGEEGIKHGKRLKTFLSSPAAG